MKTHLDPARIAAATGNGIDSYHGFTKMMWLQDERPEV